MTVLKNRFKYLGQNMLDIILPVVGFCGLAGIVVGIVVGFFNYVATMLTNYSTQIYQYVSAHPAFIPLLLLGLAILAVAMAYIHKWSPESRGSGIPQTEGMMRGIVSFKWWKVFLGTITSAFISFFAGLSLGAEGPSVQIGGAVAQGPFSLAKSRLAWQRYIISGGAGAGFAVAFNAPLSGLVFVLEEGHRRFSPVLLLSTATSIIFGVITYRLLGDVSGLWDTSQTYFNFGEFAAVSYKQILVLLSIGLSCGLAALVFNWLLIHSQRGMDRSEKNFPYWLRLIIVFVLTGILGLISIDLNFGGYNLIEKIVGRQYETWKLCILLVVKFSMILLCYNSGATGGLFIPMLAIGALIGGIIGDIAIALGMDSAYYISIVCIGMTTFFGASVRAPLTAIVLIVEVSGYDARFLPPAISIITAFIIAELFGGKPLYDSMVDRLKKIYAKSKKIETQDIDITVALKAFIIDKKISDILWPADCLVVKVRRNEKDIVPDGETRIQEGDILTLQVETGDKEETRKYLENLITG